MLMRHCFLIVLLLHGFSAAALPILGSESSSVVSWRGYEVWSVPLPYYHQKYKITYFWSTVCESWVTSESSENALSNEAEKACAMVLRVYGQRPHPWESGGKVDGAKKDIRRRAATGLPILIHVRHCF